MPLSPELLIRCGRDLHAMGWSPLIMGSDGILSQMLLTYPEEMYLMNGWLVPDVFSEGVPLTSMGQKARNIYQGMERQQGSTFTILGLEAMSLTAEALNRCAGSYEANVFQSSLPRR